MKKAGSKKTKKIRVYYIGIQNFVQLPETWHTQQICWHTFLCCEHNLLHLCKQKLIFYFLINKIFQAMVSLYAYSAV